MAATNLWLGVYVFSDVAESELAAHLRSCPTANRLKKQSQQPFFRSGCNAGLAADAVAYPQSRAESVVLVQSCKPEDATSIANPTSTDAKGSSRKLPLGAALAQSLSSEASYDLISRISKAYEQANTIFHWRILHMLTQQLLIDVLCFHCSS
jgi:hypothetical protein